jgi:hypothetical protein
VLKMHKIRSIFGVFSAWRCGIWKIDYCLASRPVADNNSVVQRGKQRVRVPTTTVACYERYLDYSSKMFAQFPNNSSTGKQVLNFI